MDISLLGPFLHYLMAECRLAPNTLAAYRSDLVKFFRWRKRSAPGPLEQLDPNQLGGYVEHLAASGLSPASIGRHLASLSAFFRFLIYEGVHQDNLAKLLTAPNVWDRLPTVISPAGVERLLNAPPLTTRLGRRDKAALEVLYATGCRASEVTGLAPTDVDLTVGTARVIGKGDKQRLVPLGQAARLAIQTYLRSDRPILVARRPQTSSLFVSRSGRPLSRVALWSIVKTHARAAGLPESTSPHALRHSFATHMLAGGADLRVVQELLGHASIDTTQIYTRVEVSRLIDAHAKFHPRG